MRKMMGFLPVFKAFMAIVYVLLGAVILINSSSLLPVNNTFRIALGILLIVYGMIRIYSSYTAYMDIKKEKKDE